MNVRLAVVTETYLPEINGVAMTWGQLVAGLAERGHALEVYRPRQRRDDTGGAPCPGVREITLPGAPVPGYPLLRFGWPAARRLRAEWRVFRPDLVHIVTEGPLGWSAMRAARALGLPLTSSYHTHFQHYTGHYGLGWLRGLALAWLRHIHNAGLATFGPTEELNRELAAAGFLRLRVLSRGVDTRRFSPRRRDPALRAEWGAGEDSPVVAHCSRLAPEKNYPALLRCYAALRAARPDARFVIVGDGPLRQRLERECPWARFLGFVSRDELARALASADLYIHASETETFGNVVTEAMASGLAVAGYDYAAARLYIRDGQNGRLAPLGRAERLAEIAVELGRDLAAARRLGRAARASAEDISWDRIVERFEADLRQAVALGSAAGSARLRARPAV